MSESCIEESVNDSLLSRSIEVPHDCHRLRHSPPGRSTVFGMPGGARIGARFSCLVLCLFLLPAAACHKPLEGEARPAIAPPRDQDRLATALQEAISAHDVDSVREALDAGADPNRPLSGGATALGLATEKANATVMNILLRAHADPRALTRFGEDLMPILFMGVQVDHADIVRMLTAAGADPNHPDEPTGLTPLAEAALLERPHACDALVRAGADVNRWSRWPPNEAARCQSGERCGRTALMIAAEYGSRWTLGCLLDHGADPRLRSHLGLTARDYANRFVSPAPRIAEALRQMELPISKRPQILVR